MNQTSPDPAESLCLSCGLCCDGGLFDRVELDPAEVDATGSARVSNAAGKRVLDQPCTAHSAASGCRIYSQRPKVCRRFRCRLLNDMRAGRKTSDEANRLVRRGLELRAGFERLAIDQLAGAGQTPPRGAMQLARAFTALSNTRQDRPDWAKRGEFALFVYRKFVQKFFRYGDPVGAGQSDETKKMAETKLGQSPTGR